MGVINNHAAVAVPDLNSDIVGRIGRLPLPRTERGTLTPLMEAISNSVHSITDRFGDDTQKNGRVTIRVSRDLDDADTPIIGFEITDNGEGFTEENYKSFCTPDSRLKELRGGKGIGRLGWLKVLENISVDSTFLSEHDCGGGHSYFVLPPKNRSKRPSLFLPRRRPERPSHSKIFAHTTPAKCRLIRKRCNCE